MTEIQQNRWDRLIRRAAGIVGGGSQVNDTLNELFPTIDVENVPGELMALSGWRLGTCSSLLVPSVGELNHHQLFNPLGSGTLVTVTEYLVETSTTQLFGLSTFIGELATLAGNERRRDTRAGTLASITAEQRTDQSVVGAGLDWRVRAVAENSVLQSTPNDIAVLFPGTGLTISGTVNNSLTLVGFRWRERAFEPSEIVG